PGAAAAIPPSPGVAPTALAPGPAPCDDATPMQPPLPSRPGALSMTAPPGANPAPPIHDTASGAPPASARAALLPRGCCPLARRCYSAQAAFAAPGPLGSREGDAPLPDPVRYAGWRSCGNRPRVPVRAASKHGWRVPQTYLVQGAPPGQSTPTMRG